MTIRVVIVDDSPTMRALLTELLRVESDIEVVGTAADARQARSAIRTLDPDVVTLDIEMPGMNGLEFLQKLMALRPTPVVIVSGLAQKRSVIAARALQIGAVDCYGKPDGFAGSILSTDQGRLAEMVRVAAQARVRARPFAPAPGQNGAMLQSALGPRLIAVGASTGGVEALSVMLAQFPADCPPTMVVQHINGAFAEAVARRLDEICRAKVGIAEPDMPMRAGHIYVAPGNERHLEVRSGPTGLSVRARPGDKISGHRPSVDMLFHSAAAQVGKDAVGVLLTGMGRDGAEGLLAMARSGARTIVQDEATSVVFGMPGAAIALGAAGVVAPLHRIAHHVFTGPAGCP